MNRSILVVEDEAVIAADIEATLRALGHEVCGVAADAEEALEVARRERPGIALMDIRLRSGGDGIEAALALRELLGIPVLFLTSHSDTATLERAKAACPYGFILKPYDARELHTAIEIALVRHAADSEVRGAHAALLQANAELEERVRERTCELARYAQAACEAREEERARVARELHDDLANPLAALKIHLCQMRDDVAPASAMRLRIDDAIAQVTSRAAACRRLAIDMRPPVLDDFGLPGALQWLCAGFERRSGIACTLENAEVLSLEEPAATHVFRIVQEALVNVSRHARASRVRLWASRGPEGLDVYLRDDGCGFDPAGTQARRRLGLVGLRERARAAGGKLEIRSMPGAGTLVHLRVEPQALKEEGFS